MTDGIQKRLFPIKTNAGIDILGVGDDNNNNSNNIYLDTMIYWRGVKVVSIRIGSTRRPIRHQTYILCIYSLL